MQEQSLEAKTVGTIDSSTQKRRSRDESSCTEAEQKRMRLLDGHAPFRSLTELQTECFQGYGEVVWNVIVKGIDEANGESPLHKQSLCACATRRLLENFEDEYIRSIQYEVNEDHCKVAKELFVRASEECKRVCDNYWESEFTTSGERMGYDPVLAARVTTLYTIEGHAVDRYSNLVHAMNHGLILKLK